jgi:fumarate reductase subunit D
VRGVGRRTDGGDPTAALVGAAGSAVAGVVCAIALLLSGVATSLGLAAGGALTIVSAVAYARRRSDAIADLVLAALAGAVFFVILSAIPFALAGWALGPVLTD